MIRWFLQKFFDGLFWLCWNVGSRIIAFPLWLMTLFD